MSRKQLTVLADTQRHMFASGPSHTASVCCCAGLFAIEILAQCPGGAWRTLSEWQALFSAAGLRLAGNTSVGCNMNLMVWKAQ